MKNNVTRRRALKALGAAGLVGLAGCSSQGGDTTTDGGDTTTEGSGGDTDTPGGTETSTMTATDTPEPQTTAQAFDGTVRIGAMQPLSGSIKYYGQQSIWGFLSGLAHKAGKAPPKEVGTGELTYSVGDIDYEIVVRDTKFSSSKAQSAATDLVKNEDVDMLFGCANSGGARQVIKNVVAATNVPYMAGPAASAGITSNKATCSDLVYRASENTAMDARSGGRYVATETDVSKVYLFGADYSFGRAVVNNYATVLKDQGVEILDKRFVERGYKQWDGLLDNAEQAGAEGIVGGFTVKTLPSLFSSFLSGDYSFRAFGGFATQITNKVVGGVMQQVLGKPLTKEKIRNAKLGPFTTRYHWNQYDNRINNSFVDRYTNAYGIVPDLFSSGTFTAASAIHQAIRTAGTTDTGPVTDALKGMTVTETPKGENGYKFQEYNNQARSEMTVAKPVPTKDKWAKNWGAAIQPGEPVARIPGKKATIPANSPDMNCSL